MTRPPVKRTPRAAGPLNPSRAAGAPAPASAAATQPFYAAASQAAPASPPIPPEAQSQLAAAAQQQHAAAVRDQALHTGDGNTADAGLSEHAAVPADPMAPPSAAEIARLREMRKPLGAYSQKLALPKRPGYHRHWFNDVAGRVDEASASGWSHVLDKDRKPLKRAVGTGRDNGVMYAYAMELPEVFWQEDMDARHEQAAATVASTKANPFKAAPGSAKPSDKGKFYSPSEEPLTVGVR